MPNATREDVRKLLRRFLRADANDSLVPALMGKKTGASSWTYDVPGERGLKYVRVLQGSDAITVMQCVNEAGVPGTGDLPIWIKQDVGARWVIVKERFNA